MLGIPLLLATVCGKSYHALQPYFQIWVLGNSIASGAGYLLYTHCLLI